MQTITLYLGLDVHKDSITIAIAQPGSKGEVRVFGTITNDVERLEKALGRIRKAHPGAILVRTNQGHISTFDNVASIVAKMRCSSPRCCKRLPKRLTA